MILDTEYYENLKEKTRKLYNKVGKIYCPCLKDYIFFTSDGFDHLLYKVSGRKRTRKEQAYKLKLIPLAISVIKKTDKVYSYEQRLLVTIRRKKIASRKKNAEYWCLMKKVGKKRNVKTKVILRRVGTGKISFWSIMKVH